jgi:hypothetical protein
VTELRNSTIKIAFTAADEKFKCHGQVVAAATLPRL